MPVNLRSRRPIPVHLPALRCVILAAALSCQAAIAADLAPAALVMEVSGATQPSLAANREVAAGTRIGLGPGARISLLHYSTCSIVTVAGGSVTVTAQGTEIDPAATQSARPGPCPRVHRIQLSGPGPLGGVVVSRAIGTPNPPLVVAADAVVLMTGAGAGRAGSADVLEVSGTVIARALPIVDRSLRLPGALAPRRPYVLRLHLDGQDEYVDVPITTAGPAAGGMLVLRLE